MTIAFGAALMLADRAPRLIRRVLGGFARRLSDRIDAGGRSPVSLDARPGEGDWIVHLGLWSIAVVFVALMLWTSRGLWLAALGVFALSVVIEIGQGVWSTTRTVEFSDVVFNALGVAIGAAVAHGVFVAWDAAVSRARRRMAAR